MAGRVVPMLAVSATLLGSALVAAGVGGLATAPPPADPLPAQAVSASAAVWVAAEAGPDRGAAGPGPGPARLRAGDVGGGAISFLRFEVPESGPPGYGVPRLWLTAVDQPPPYLVELVSVPDTGWPAEGFEWADAPVLGPVVDSVAPGDDRMAFDVSAVVTGPGPYAFAVTVPPDRGSATFVGADGSPDQPTLELPVRPSPTPSGSPVPPTPSGSPVPPTPSGSPVPPSPPGPVPAPSGSSAPAPSGYPTPPATITPTVTPTVDPGDPGDPGEPAPECTVDERLVPSCGKLWGAAPAAHTGLARSAAVARFEADTGRRLDIYHAYHRGTDLFPTRQEVALAAEGRLLYLNWKPLRWSWAAIAAGHPEVDAHLDRLADHIRTTFPDPFFLTVHHEPENDVRVTPGSGWEPGDYAAMYRYVVERLRAAGVTNVVTVVNYMAYVPWNTRPWFDDLYPGDDVVDWIGWSAYSYSDPGYGFGDFGEMMNRRSASYPDWPGLYTWATTRFPDKPFMLGEWGVWHSSRNPGHMARFYDSAARQAPLYPRVRAMVYFDTPADQRGRDSRPTTTAEGLAAYRRLAAQPFLSVRLCPDPAACPE